MDHTTIIFLRAPGSPPGQAQSNLSSMVDGSGNPVWLVSNNDQIATITEAMDENSVLRMWTQDKVGGGTEWAGDYYNFATNEDPLPEAWSDTADDIQTLQVAFLTWAATP